MRYRVFDKKMFMVKKIGIVSLSSGILGESFIKHELKIGVDRLNKYGIEVEFLPNALKGIDFIKEHPESRAKDLIEEVEAVEIALGIDNTNAITITLSCLGNVGPTLGMEIGPTMSWAQLPDFAKWICSFLMLVGRLELFTVLVLFTPAFWKKN